MNPLDQRFGRHQNDSRVRRFSNLHNHYLNTFCKYIFAFKRRESIQPLPNLEEVKTTPNQDILQLKEMRRNTKEEFLNPESDWKKPQLERCGEKKKWWTKREY